MVIMETVKITKRERQILIMIEQGMLSKQIAPELGISLQTVKNHRSNIINKLKAVNSVHAVLIAKDRGTI